MQLADGAAVVADVSYMRESILMPHARLTAGYQATMPTYQGQVNEEGVMSLIEYIKSLPAASRGRWRGAAGHHGAAATAGRVRAGP